jgi:hypothetical protein
VPPIVFSQLTKLNPIAARNKTSRTVKNITFLLNYVMPIAEQEPADDICNHLLSYGALE